VRNATSTCPICSTALPPRKATGRPNVYCSPACRKSAELKLRRMNALLADLERRLSETRADPILARLDADAADRLEAEVARLTLEQRDLIAQCGTPHQTEV